MARITHVMKNGKTLCGSKSKSYQPMRSMANCSKCLSAHWNEQEQDPITVTRELLRQARDTVQACSAEEGISEDRKAWRRVLLQRLDAALL